MNNNNNKLYIVICLPTEHLRVHMKSLKPVCAFQIELEFGSVKERGKLEYPGKNLSEQGREPRRHFTHIWRQHQDSNQGYISGRQVLSPLLMTSGQNGSQDIWVGGGGGVRGGGSLITHPV